LNACEIRGALDAVYGKYNRREFLRPDPLQFLYDYPGVPDRELAALVASSLAYGRVAQIIRSVEDALKRMGKSPRQFVEENSAAGIVRAFDGFKHRFTDGAELARLLSNAKLLIESHGSLENAFKSALAVPDYLRALDTFSSMLNGNSPKANYLVPRPSSGSACKRLNLMMKWLVRRDEIDPGGWSGIPKSMLIIPLDTHMWQIAVHLGFTRRKTADLKAALEITRAFRNINPDDPCKYDFALTRLGIRNTGEMRHSIHPGGIRRGQAAGSRNIENGENMKLLPDPKSAFPRGAPQRHAS